MCPLRLRWQHVVFCRFAWNLAGARAGVGGPRHCEAIDCAPVQAVRCAGVAVGLTLKLFGKIVDEWSSGKVKEGYKRLEEQLGRKR
jgi:hypothetical protein